MLIGLDMLEAKRSPTQESSGETAAAATKDDVGIVPMGIPMLAGPGAITSVMVLVGQAHQSEGYWQMAAIYGAIAITAAICYLVLGSASRVASALGDTGIRILIRIMGLLLVALAVQLSAGTLGVRAVVICRDLRLADQQRRCGGYEATQPEEKAQHEVRLLAC